MAFKVRLLRKLEQMDPASREAFLSLLEVLEEQFQRLEDQVTKAEFNELRAVVAELAEAQKRTEERMGAEFERVWGAINELTQAQKRTEAEVRALAEAQRRSEGRLDRLEATVAELVEIQKQTQAEVRALAEAQRRSEGRLDRLEATVAELVEIQKQTQAEVRALAEAQKRTEAQVAELAEAQKRTEEELRQLAEEHRLTRERVEGVSNAVGYTLEDRAMRALPALLRQEGIEVEGKLVRQYVRVGDRERQVNIFGYGRRNGQRVLILGEAKVRPSKKEVARFLKLAASLEKQEGLPAVLLFVAYDCRPEVEAYLREKNIRFIWSYDLPL